MTSLLVYKEILRHVPENATILDLACGKGIMGSLIRLYKNPKFLIGVDKYIPYINFCLKYRIYDSCLCADILDYFKFGYIENCDVIILSEILEHLCKHDGFILLTGIEAYTKKIIISTPNKFFNQKEIDNNPYQKHKSFWSQKELRRYGYKIIGADYFKINNKYLSYLFQPLTRYFPRFALETIGIKDI